MRGEEQGLQYWARLSGKEKLRGLVKVTEFGQVEWEAMDSKLNGSAEKRISMGYS